MLYDIFIDTLLCGATGYITNKYVINMLFKKYSFFNKIRCGDSIINSKMQFIKNVSTMMEKDIINAQKISEKFIIHNFNEEFESFSQDFFNKCICRDIKNLRLKDIPVFYDACICGKDIIVNILDINMKSILQNIANDINLSSVITEKQVEYISKNIIQNIILTIQNTQIVDNIASETFDAFCDVKINEIISKNISNKLKKNIEKEAIKFSGVIKQNIDEKIDSAFNEILYQVDITKILEKMQDSILEKPIKSLVNLTTEDIRKIANENIIDFINSDKGEKSIENIYYELKDYLVNSNISLFDIYKKDYEDVIKKQMKNRVNNIAYSVMQWIDSNNIELNDVIKESVDEIISGNDELRAKIYLTINEYYNSKKYNDSSIVKLLLEFAVNGDNLDKISSFIIAEIGNYLKSRNARDIINTLEDRKIISADVLTTSVINFLKDNKGTLNYIIDNITSKPLGDFINLDLVKFFNSKLKYVFIDYIKENTFYSKEIHVSIAREVSDYIFNSFDNKISEFINKEYLIGNTDTIKKILIKDIKSNENAITTKINDIINDFISKNNIANLFDKLSETNQTFDIRVSEKLTNLINKNFSRLVDDIGDTRVSRVMNTISSIPNIHDSLSGFMKNVVGESIATITEGYISEIVEKHFDEFTNDEFINYIKDSTLTKPKNLSISGGVIGGTLGLSASLASINLFSKPLINSVFSWQGVVLNSIIGVSTNFVAMEGFSTANIKNSFLANIPILKNCTDKFIKKKQENFAGYMSTIVKANLIDKEMVQDLVQSKSTQIKENIHKTIVDNEYQHIYECFENNNKYISSNLSTLTKKTLDKNKNNIATYISKEISDIPIKHLINRNLIDSIMDEVNSKKSVIIDEIFAYINKHLEEDISVLDCIPKDLIERINDEILLSVEERFIKGIEFLKDTESLKKYFLKYKKSYDNFLNEPLINILSQDRLEGIYSNLFNSIYDNIFTEDKLNELSEKTYYVLNNQFNTQTTLEDALNRRSKIFLNGMFYKYFKDIILSLQSYLTLNRHTKIESDIKEKLLNSLNLKERSAYNAIGGDKALFDIINNLILIKLPLFFDRNFEQFYEISKGITGDIFSVKLEELSANIDNNKLEKFIKELFIGNEKNPIVKNKSFLIFNLYMQKYSDMELKAIASHAYIDNIGNIFIKYDNEISSCLKQLYSETKKSKIQILKEIKGVVSESSYKIFDSILIKRLFVKIGKNDLINMEKAIRDIIEANDLIYLNINSVINCFYNYLEDIDLMDSIINIDELKLSMDNLINKIVGEKSFNLFIESLYSQIVSNDLKLSAYMCITKNVKKYFVDMLVDGFYIAIKKNLSNIFQSIDLDEITKEEIKNLPSEKYQEIYKVFWKNNLKNTVWTGIAGGIIGANKYVGMALTLLETIKGIPKIKKKQIKDQ